MALLRTLPGKPLEAVLLLCLVMLGATLRLSFVDRRDFSVDEAESGINALTILQRGYPTDRYLGLPIYENVLLTTTPDSAEYEFKDSSYSDRGVAIYHGWLPLYSIAAAYALAGIHPDVDSGGPPVVRHPATEIKRRTIVPRLPAILFAMIFLASVYQLGRTVSGAATAWSLLLAGAFAAPFVDFGWQARYYSATLAVSTVCALAVWNFSRKGRWRDAVTTGLALVLLFHTHSLSFAILTALLLINLSVGYRQSHWHVQLLLTGAIVALGIVPWMYWTGFFESAVRIPSAWPLLVFPQDFVWWFATRKVFLAIIGGALALVLMAATQSDRPLSPTMTAAGAERRAFYFAATWFAIAFGAFMFLIPAGSFYRERLTLVVAVPGYLLFALSIAMFSRVMVPNAAQIVSPVLMVVFLILRRTAGVVPEQPAHPGGMSAFVDLVSSWKLDGGTKVYAFPNSNLTLTYYLGLPVQSIAPVRKSFLDNYPGDVILLETGTPYIDLATQDVQAIGNTHGTLLSAEDAQQVMLRVQRHGARQYLQGRVASIWPAAESLGAIELAVLEKCETQTRKWGEKMAAEFPLFRGFTPALMMNSQWAPVHYWFVNPKQRIGNHLNYRDRIRSATGIVLPNGAIVFDARRSREVPLIDRTQYLALLHMAARSGR